MIFTQRDNISVNDSGDCWERQEVQQLIPWKPYRLLIHHVTQQTFYVFQDPADSSNKNRGKIAGALNGFIWSLKKAVFHNSILNKANVTTTVASTPSHVAKCKKTKNEKFCSGL